MMNPANIMKIMNAKNKFTANHPKFGSVRSEGMQQEIKWAKRRHMTIRYFTEELEEIE